ncbi:prepilin-type N-terminal cleavage/methylation domain-containing protein [Acinetobacter guerrae]|uniref:prepilin-type N-terminal cleavage/methylation domain-containing protein n=1 Tax=Acinetobacter guerrae TaxID=1843371 RepID=UPI00128CA3D6|nr:prepilin-type N-terminal cleavage/methylation domain-containing protein [Acinetobacter guerrae]MPW44145.1 prepilin-type N-terminal cleavage/methylation domain-containing protein [Acinetobacter guerrae]
MGKSLGFTLIELMVTIAVLAIIATMAAPSMSNLMEKRRYENNTRELLLVLSQAKSQAILNRTNVNANLSSNNPNNATTLNWVVLNNYTTLVVTPPVPSATFIFDQNGLVSNIAGDTSIILCNSKLNIKKTIILTRLGAYIIKPDSIVSAC